MDRGFGLNLAGKHRRNRRTQQAKTASIFIVLLVFSPQRSISFSQVFFRASNVGHPSLAFASSSSRRRACRAQLSEPPSLNPGLKGQKAGVNRKSGAHLIELARIFPT